MCEVAENRHGFMVVDDQFGESHAIFWEPDKAEEFLSIVPFDGHIEQVDFDYELMPEELLK